MPGLENSRDVGSPAAPAAAAGADAWRGPGIMDEASAELMAVQRQPRDAVHLSLENVEYLSTGDVGTTGFDTDDRGMSSGSLQ